MSFAGRSILLIISGGIAAYKSLELIRRLRERGAAVRCVLTAGGARFITPLSVAALSEQKVHQDLWDLTDDSGMAHIRLARTADLVLVAPASANLLARAALGLAEDLAGTLLLANTRPVLMAPAMNPVMWEQEIVQQHLAALRARGVRFVLPGRGAMACGEEGAGRLAEVPDILAAVDALLGGGAALEGKRALVTSGPTHEPIDPVRMLANRSSGRQGHAIAAALRDAGAAVTLITGPVERPDPHGLRCVHVQTAVEMHDAVMAALPVDIAVCAAAVADWRVAAPSAQKIKKGMGAPVLELAENPDILAALAAAGPRRPRLVIGFAAETQDVEAQAEAKLARKGCDWLLANKVGAAQGFGDEENAIVFLRRGGAVAEEWPVQSKEAIARQLAGMIGAEIGEGT